MTSLGRGRGWATAQSDKPALRRPGTIPVQAFDCTSLINEITQIQEDDDVRPIVKDVTARVSNIHKDNLKSVINKLYISAINDKKFGLNFMRVFTTKELSTVTDNDNMNARNFVVSAMQVDYERREELMKENPVYCRNTACLLFEGYKHMRTSKQAGPTRPFVMAAIGYLELFLDNPSLENLELFADQIVKYGCELYEIEKTAMDSIMVNVRKTVITQNLPALSRALLLFVLDLSNCKFKHSSLTKDIRILYSQQFGESAPMFLGSCVEFLEETVENSEANESTESTSPPISNTVPRAIRGSGATRIQTVQKKTRASLPTASRSGKKKGWNHDDRFEKDYST